MRDVSMKTGSAVMEAIMAQTITKSAKDIVKAAMAAVPAISVDEALGLVGNDTHILLTCATVVNRQSAGSSPARLHRPLG